jgi:hypothetical protein
MNLPAWVQPRFLPHPPNRVTARSGGRWFLAHRHGRLQDFVDANKNGVDDRLENRCHNQVILGVFPAIKRFAKGFARSRHLCGKSLRAVFNGLQWVVKNRRRIIPFICNVVVTSRENSNW